MDAAKQRKEVRACLIRNLEDGMDEMMRDAGFKRSAKGLINRTFPISD